ncbi:MAG: DUF4287 domain-containing protein [Gammaproteobacteria bacterium]
MTPADSAVQKMIANLPEKTGKSLDQWLEILAGQPLGKHGEIVKWLKGEHGLTHGFANLIAHSHREAVAGGAASGSDLVDAQYSGPRAGLRPIYEAIIGVVAGFGDDVEIAPKKTYVSLRRARQFALVQPSTRNRVDVGINLKGDPPTSRLEASGSFNAMVSHRVRISDEREVDAELKRWLRKAYDSA